MKSTVSSKLHSKKIKTIHIETLSQGSHVEIYPMHIVSSYLISFSHYLEYCYLSRFVHWGLACYLLYLISNSFDGYISHLVLLCCYFVELIYFLLLSLVCN